MSKKSQILANWPNGLLLEKVKMQRTKITRTAIDSLIILLMISFVISDVFPDYSNEQQTVKMEETDLDGEESSEEKKENEEQKKNFQEDFLNASSYLFESQDISSQRSNMMMLQELCLPVITPPPDLLTKTC